MVCIQHREYVEQQPSPDGIGIAPLIITRAPHYPPVARTGTGDVLTVRCPWDDAVLARIPTTRPEEIDRVVGTAVAAAAEFRKVPAWRRAEILQRTSQLLWDCWQEMAQVIALEACKPICDAMAEARRLSAIFAWAAEEAKRVVGEVIPMDAEQAGEGRFGWTLRQPRGVVLAIGPFNFPGLLVAHKIAPAIAAGNAVILKPASATPLTGLWLREVLEEAGLPQQTCQVVIGPGSQTGRLLAEDDRVAMVSFTGSPSVGDQLARVVGKKPLTLELGSNGPVIVDESADLDLALERVIAGGFACSGQACMSVQRIIVHERVMEEFVPRLVEEVRTLRLGPPLEESTNVSALITPADENRIAAWVREAEAAGAKLECGGQDEKTGRLHPMVVTSVRPGMKLHDCEVFGPLVAVIAVKDFNEAIAVANDSVYGLQAGVFTRDIAKALRAAASLHVGGVMINEASLYRVEHMPFGGVKDSGVGREGLKYAVQEMTETKMVTLRPTD